MLKNRFKAVLETLEEKPRDNQGIARGYGLGRRNLELLKEQGY